MWDGFYFADSVYYSAAAVNLVENGEFGASYKRPPVYPVFLAGIYALFGQKIIAIRIVEAVIGACLAILIAIIARRIGGATVGALAGILWGTYPMGVFIAGLVYPTSVVTTVLACAVYCMLTNVDQELGPGRVILGGMLFGLAALTKPVALVTVIATTLWIIYWKPTRRLLLPGLFLLGVALTLAPWTVRNFYVYGGFVIVEPRLAQHLDFHSNTSSDGQEDKHRKGIEAVLRRPGEFIIHFAREFGHFWELYPQRARMKLPAIREKQHEKNSRIVRKTIFGTMWTDLISVLSVGPMFFFAIIGAGAMWFKKERRRHLSLLFLVILSFAIGYSFFYGTTRYRIPVEPYIIILSAYGLHHIWTVLLQPDHKRITRFSTGT